MILVAVVYAGVAWLVALLLTFPRASWRARAAAIIVLPGLAFAVWQAAQPPQGWPTTIPQPREAAFIWGVVREPDPQTADRGRIFLWLDIGASRPRAYSLPYTRQLHRQVQQAVDATKHGHPIDVRQAPKGKHRGGAHSARGGQRGSRLEFYPQPPIKLPAKGKP